MAKRKSTKGQTIVYKTLHKKTKDGATQTPLKTGDELGYIACPIVLPVLSRFTVFVFSLGFLKQNKTKSTKITQL